MSATVDRLVELEQRAGAMPWPLGAFGYVGRGWPAEAFVFFYALNQAWPLLREELIDSEARAEKAETENAQLRGEHGRLVYGATALGHQLRDLKIKYDNETASLREEAKVARQEAEEMQKAIANLPTRMKMAEKVCASIRRTMPGPKRAVPTGAHGWYDGAALDAWKSAH